MPQIFNTDYKATGKHAIMFRDLVKYHFFEHFWQICVTAPLIGFIYKRKTQPDRNDSIKPSTIFLAQLTPRYEIIKFIYRLIMLADENNTSSPDERIKKAFMSIDTDAAKEDEQLFNSYLLGGVEVLYEKLINKNSIEDNVEGSNDVLPDTLIKNLGHFIEEIGVSENVIDEMGLNEEIL